MASEGADREPSPPYAEVAVDAPVPPGSTFTYAIPPGLALSPGHLVVVPLRQTSVAGVVFGLSQTTDAPYVLMIFDVLEVEPFLSPHQLALARWMSPQYLAPLYACAALMLPPGYPGRPVTSFSLVVPNPDLDSLALSLLDQKLMERLQGRDAVSLAALKRSSDGEIEEALASLEQRGLVQRTQRWHRSESKRPLRPSPDRDPLREAAAELPLSLLPEQAAAVQRVASALDGREGAPRTFLLHGVTGSGKTEVYLQALAHAIARGKRGIVLVPEISLTPQMVQRFSARFPGRVAVLHSHLTPAQRLEQWWRIRRGEADVVIGPRSALFAPQPDLGLIVLDEEHEWTYKQEEAAPRYHAREAALELGRSTGAVVVLGSATPDVGTYYEAQGNGHTLLELPHRVPRHDAGDGPEGLSEVQVVDMRHELRDGNRSIFSRALATALEETVGAGQQALLFLNRRGSASHVQCRDCGHTIRCRSCAVALTYHASLQRLLCHHCGRSALVPVACPACWSRRIRLLGAGTQRVAEEVQERLPHVQVLRWDRDSAGARGAHEQLLQRFERGEAQVLVGTQMIAKGLHLPDVTLVGVLLADLGLYLPDFRAGERVFQLLCQVVGRGGRGLAPGRALIQTYNPQHYAVSAAAAQDYQTFYQREIQFRRQYRHPPFWRLARLLFQHTNQATCQREAKRVGHLLSASVQVASSRAEVLGPAPAYPERVRGRYRWHLLLRAQGDLAPLVASLRLREGWIVDIDPVSLT